MATLRNDIFAAPEVSQNELDALSASGMSSLARGLRSGFIGTDINAAAAREASLRASTDPQALAQADAERAQIDSLRQKQSMYAPAVGRVEGIDGVGSALSYAAGQVGQGMASMADPLAAGAALQGAGNLLSRGPGMFKAGGALLKGAGYAVPFVMNQRQMTGEAYNAMVDDPELMARTSAQEREMNANLYGAAAGALDTVVPGMIAGRLAGGGLRQGIAQSGLGARTLKGMGMEGMTELGQQAGQQQVLGYMNPDRDTAGDFSDNLNAFVGGAIGSGPMVMAGEAADSGYRRVGDTAQRVSEKAGETVDLLAEKAGPAAAAAKTKLGKVVDLFKGGAKDAADKAQSAVADFETHLDEREIISGMPPDSVDANDKEAFASWYSEAAPKRMEVVADRLGKLADQGDERAAAIYDGLTSEDDVARTEALEAGAAHIMQQGEWAELERQAGERAKQAGRLATRFGSLAARAGKAAGGAAMSFGKAVIAGAKEGAKKNAQGMEGESLVGADNVYDPDARRLGDAAVDKEALNWDQGRQRSYNRASLMSEFMAEELKTAQAMPAVRMPKGSPEVMTGFMKDMGLEIADLAENWHATPKREPQANAPVGPISALKNPADSKGQQYDGLKLSVNRIVRSMKLAYGERAAQVLDELQSIDQNSAPELFDFMRDELATQMSPRAARHNAEVEREAQNAVIGALGQDTEARLLKEGVNVRTGDGKKQLMSMVQAVDDGIAPPAAVRALENLVGKEQLLAMRRTIRPKQANREDLVDDGGVTNGEGINVNDDGEVELNDQNNFDKALGETKRDRMSAKRLIGFRGTQNVRLEGGDKRDVFAAPGGTTRQAILEFQDEFGRAMEAGKSPKDRPAMPAGMRRPRLALRGDKFDTGEDAVEGSRVRFERRIGAERTPAAMIKALRAEGNERGAALAESMLNDGVDLSARSRAFFENRSEGGKWAVKSVSVKDYLNEEGADPLRRAALYRDYIQQAAYAKDVTPKEYQQLLALSRRISTVIGDLAEQTKPTGNSLRASPGERKAILEAANNYFADRFISVADQMTDATPEQISAGEIDDMAAMGRRMMDSARKGRGKDAAFNYPALSKKNIIVFEHKDKDREGNTVFVPIPANRLAAWGKFQRAVTEGTKEQDNKADKGETFSNTDKDMEFLQNLSVGIQAIRTSGAVKDAFPFKMNAIGDAEKFQSTGRLKGAMAVLDGLPDSLELATMTVKGLKTKIEKGSERYRNEILPEQEEYRAKNSIRIEMQNDAKKLGEWSDEPFVAGQDEDAEGVNPSELWGTLGSAVGAAGGRMAVDKSRGTQPGIAPGATPFLPQGEGQTVQRTSKITAAPREKQETLLLHALTQAQRTKYRRMAKRGDSEGIADMLRELPAETRQELELTGFNGAQFVRGNPSFKSSEVGGWNKKGTIYEPGPTPSDFGDAPDGFDDVQKRTNAHGRSAAQRSKGQLGPEVPMTASKMAESRAQTIRAALIDDPMNALAIIERRLRQAELPRWSENKNSVTGGAQYAIPVIKALDDDTLAQFDADDELKALRDKAIAIVRSSDLNKTLKAEFAPGGTTKPAAKEVGASLGKPSGAGKTLNVWHGSGENAQFSNLAGRPFTFESRPYRSVEHAYQSLKSGAFDLVTYGKYHKDGVKITGTKGTKSADGWNIGLMNRLVLESFKQNPEAAEALAGTGNAKFTHTQDTGVWRDAFPAALEAARAALGKPSGVQVRESTASGYATRTKHNADATGATVAIAADFTTAGEKLTKRVAGDKLLPIDIEGDLEGAGAELAAHMKKLGTTTLNVAGNGIYTLAKTDWDQSTVNYAVYQIIAEAHAIQPITFIVSGGQTGVDIAGAVAAKALGIPAEITLPAGYLQRGADKVDRQHTRAEIGKQIVDGAAALGKPTGVGTKTGTKFNRQSEDIHTSLGRDGFAATHDSPIRHEGKFDWRAHSGKGEGNAAFGAGTYLSTADGVHKSYKGQFTAEVAKHRTLEWDGVEYSVDEEYNEVSQRSDSAAKDAVIYHILMDGMGAVEALAAAKESVYNLVDRSARDIVDNLDVSADALGVHPDAVTNLTRKMLKRERLTADDVGQFSSLIRVEQWNKVVSRAEKLAGELKTIDVSGVRASPLGASPTYQVSVDIKPEQLLDWDKPLSEQSELVQKALFVHAAGASPDTARAAMSEPDKYPMMFARLKASAEKATGQEIYKRLTKQLGSQAKASDYLQSLGILGHRYNAAGGKNDTHPNYVIYDDSKVTTNYVHFNKQGKNTPESTQAERDAATAEIIKTLGKDIDVRFEQTTGFSGAYLDKEAAIVISMTPAAGTLQTAYHEALHAFVARLVKGNAKAERVLNSLANHQPTLERVHALLDGFPAAQAQLADGEERIAFIYQFWRAGLLDLPASPGATMLQKLRKFFRGILGRVSDLERSGDLLAAFAAGSYAGDVSVAGKVMAKTLSEGTWGPRTMRKMDAVAQRLAAWTVPSQSLLLMSDSPTAQKLGNVFWTNPGDEDAGTMKEGYLNARERMAKRYTNEFSRIVNGFTERDHKDVAKYLQAEVDASTIAYQPHREAVEKIRGLLQRFRKYMVEERGMKIGDRGPLYFPRVWSPHRMAAKKVEFLKMMAVNHPTYDAEAVYNAIVTKLEQNTEDSQHGRENEDAVLKPAHGAGDERILAFITGEQAQPFLEDSLVGALSRYFHEGARAAEYTARFGQTGKRLEKALAMIHTELRAAGKKRRDDGELADQDAETKWVARQLRDVTNAVDAMEGTLGSDISDAWRKTNSWVTVYQNVRLLPMALFSSIVDPLGMLARGATMRDAYDGFLRGMSEVVKNWGEMATGKTKEREIDKWERLAMAVGSVDAAVFNHHVSDEYASVFMSAGAKKINDFMFKANGMEAWNRGMRVAATRAAALFILRHKGLPDTHSKRWLTEIGLKPADIHVDADGELVTNKHVLAAQLGIDVNEAAKQVEKVHYAINRWVQGAVLTPNAAQRPAWGSDPHYSMFFHLKQFAYSFHQTILKRAVNEMNYGNLAPMGAFVWYIPVMIASDITKGLIQGGGELPSHMKGMDLGDWVAHGAERSGLLGVGQMGIDASGDLASIGGPAVEQIIDAYSDPLERTMIKAAPAHGLYAEILK